jgi:hypothetical protein
MSNEISIDIYEEPITIQPVSVGVPGPGVPSGGAIGQVVIKNGSDSYVTKWGDIIKECASEAEQTAAFAAGVWIVIRTDLL